MPLRCLIDEIEFRECPWHQFIVYRAAHHAGIAVQPRNLAAQTEGQQSRPQPTARKLLYRLGSLSHPFSHGLGQLGRVRRRKESPFGLL
jgi:hypothetical protein